MRFLCAYHSAGMLLYQRRAARRNIGRIFGICARIKGISAAAASISAAVLRAFIRQSPLCLRRLYCPAFFGAKRRLCPFAPFYGTGGAA